jgi:hypothetical protein
MYPEALKYPWVFKGVMLWQAQSINPRDLSCQFLRKKALIDEKASSIGL